ARRAAALGGRRGGALYGLSTSTRGSKSDRGLYARLRISAWGPSVRLNRRFAAKLLVAPVLLAGLCTVDSHHRALPSRRTVRRHPAGHRPVDQRPARPVDRDRPSQPPDPRPPRHGRPAGSPPPP